MTTGRLPDPSQTDSTDQRRHTGDDLDHAIVRMLAPDGRRAFSEIAQHLGVSEGTVRNRVARMKEAGVLRIVAIADPAATDYQTSVMLGLKVAHGRTPQEVAERLGAHAAVVYVLWVTGRYDLIVEIVCEGQEHLLAFLETEIHSAGDLGAIEVMPGLRNFKNQFLLKRDWTAIGGDTPQDIKARETK